MRKNALGSVAFLFYRIKAGRTTKWHFLPETEGLSEEQIAKQNRRSGRSQEPEDFVKRLREKISDKVQKMHRKGGIL